MRVDDYADERETTVLVPIGADANEKQLSAEIQAKNEVGQGYEVFDVQVVGPPKPHASRAHEWWGVRFKVRSSADR